MPIVTISRGSMSGGQNLAQCLAEALQVPCVGREIVLEAAAKLGVSDQVLAAKLERSPSFWDRLTSERRIYVAAVQAALAEHAASGNLLYHGYAGHLLLAGVPAVLRVRLIAPLEKRIQAVIESQGLDRSEAEAYIRKVDEERVRWTRMVYGVDLRDPALYDLVINLDVMSLQSACATVVEAVHQPEYLVTPEVLRELADFALASRVRLALAVNPTGRGLNLQVQARDGVVTVSGELPQAITLTRVSTRWEQEFTNVVQGVPGVKGVRFDLEPVSGYR
ncbi:MAG: cytidylate kinase family protein [Thermoanaerobaculaceae bacterium]|nr:cytidylate kinase family protein [Thermoanaerobaculaceae bacterium]